MLSLLLVVPAAHAFDVGHSRVMSAPGEALVVEIPLRNISINEGESLSVSLPDSAAWQASGLRPPVSLERLQVSVLPGADASSRLVRLSSPDPAGETVIDVLLNVSTGSANRVIQSSLIVLPAPKVNLPGERSVIVKRGDTLSGIASQFPVSGANLYQRLWALFQVNPNAFMSENMNLLKSGATLNIPDEDTVRAIDPAFAKARYLAHILAFQRMRAGGAAVPATPDDTVVPPPAPVDQSRGQVQAAVTPAAPPEQDQVRLSSAPADIAADQQTSQGRALTEEQARTAALERNIEVLQDAISATEGSVEASTSSSAQARAAQESTGQANANQVSSEQLAATTGKASDSVTTGTKNTTGSDNLTGNVTGNVTGNGVDAETNANAGAPAASGNTSATEAGSGVGGSALTDPPTAAMEEANKPSLTGRADPAGEMGAEGVTAKTDGATGSSLAASTVMPNSPSAGAAPIDGVAVDNAGDVGKASDISRSSNSANATANAAVGATRAADAVSAGAAVNNTATGDGSSAARGNAPAAKQSIADNTADGRSVVAGSEAPIDALTGAEPAEDAVTRAIDWVSNNVAASIAIVLALFALILAWALRASSREEEFSPAAGVSPEMAFKEKLASIDLSLDDEPTDPPSATARSAGSDDPAQPTPSKTSTPNPPKNDGSA